jgi:hypothetical protein
VIAVIDWRSAVQLKENQRFLERAGSAGRVRPREWRAGSAKYRSLTLLEDGSCDLQTFSTAATARRLGGVIVGSATRKTGMGKRG